MMNIRIKTQRKELKLTQAFVGNFIGVSKATVSQWESGDTSPNGINLDKLSKVLKTSVDWILYGRNTNIIKEEHRSATNDKQNVPLINWVQAGTWMNIIEGFAFDDAENYPCPERHSSSTFALSVVGESMSPDFIPGEIIYVDPEVQPASGSCVVVQQNGDDEATFKQIIYDGNKKYLKALNPNWPTPIIEMLPDAVICGVVIGSYRKRI